MTWVRIDDSFYQHPKVMEAGPLGLAMQVAALCYANRNLTDGFISRAVGPTLLNLDDAIWPTWNSVADGLVEAGLWEKMPRGFQIHDYEKYQPTRAQVEAERIASAERQQRWRDAHSNGVSNASVTED